MILPPSWLCAWIAFYAICMLLSAGVLLKSQKATDFERLLLLLYVILASLGVGGFTACHMIYYRFDAVHGLESYIIIPAVIPSSQIWVIFGFIPTLFAGMHSLTVVFGSKDDGPQSLPTVETSELN